jgi:sigma-B regulation protein RsbU (phosphoserine phosphatase)
MTSATRAFAGGDFAHRIRIEGQDELWGIAESFNKMAGKLEAMREVEHRALRLEKELEIARQVQQGLFPSELPRCAGWEVAATCRPARQVAGDYYDVFSCGDDLVFALGDVSGKGLGPALVMANAQATIRSRLRRGGISLSTLFEELNQQLLESSSAGMFITLFIGIVDTRTGRLRYANGGHNPPYLCPGPGAEPRPLVEGGVIVGALPDMRWEEAEALMPPGSALFVYSDGLTEAVDETGDMYDERRLLELLVGAGPAGAADLLAGAFEGIDRFRGRAEQSDDMSVVVIRRQPA